MWWGRGGMGPGCAGALSPSCDPRVGVGAEGGQGRSKRARALGQVAAPWLAPGPWPRIWQSSWRRRCILGMPASCCSSRCFSSVRLRRAAESSFSNFQPPSPSNCSKWVWYFLRQERDREEALSGPPGPSARVLWEGRAHLPQGGSVGDGKQRDACILGCLEDLPFHVDAHSTGTLIQESVLGPWGCGHVGEAVGLWGQCPRLAPAPQAEAGSLTPVLLGPQGWGQASKQFCPPHFRRSQGKRIRELPVPEGAQAPGTGRLAAHLW